MEFDVGHAHTEWERDRFISFFSSRGWTDHSDREAVVTASGERLSYGELDARVTELAASLGEERSLCLVEVDNDLTSLVAYLACLRGGHPVILAEPGATVRDPRIETSFRPHWLFQRDANDGSSSRFVRSPSAKPIALHPDLCVLLSTSGTTGSPKLVRLSVANVQSNAVAIAQYLELSPAERAITSLPFHYSYGLSIINSHLAVGATLLLQSASVARDEFWTFFDRERATSLAGVPYTFELLERRGFRRHTPASLRYLTQAGGRLPKELVATYAQWARDTGRKFFVMYGQTEASPRMAYVPPTMLEFNTECIGTAIPGGEILLRAEDGAPVEQPEQPGELVYRGPNVMMGYAETTQDLSLGSGLSELATGDLACRKANGLYYIVGRKSRFAKIFGLRISLDEIEGWLRGQGIEAIVAGNDRVVAVATTEGCRAHESLRDIARRYALADSVVQVVAFDQLPLLSSGKYDYKQVLELALAAQQVATQSRAESIADQFKKVLKLDEVAASDSFLDLGGDSLYLVELGLYLEETIGFLPDNWEAMPIAALERLRVAARATPVPAVSGGRGKRFRMVLLLVALGLLGAEAAVQMRAYLKTGRSAAALVTGNSAIQINTEWNVKTYRPEMVIKDHAGRGGEFRTNSLGFRSAEVSSEQLPGELRVLVVGASTVAGAYAKTNQDTFTFLLETMLRQREPDRPINIINGGVEGLSAAEILRLAQGAIAALQPDALIILPGFNDLASICHRADEEAISRAPLPSPKLPSWVLSTDLVAKNTTALRNAPPRPGMKVVPDRSMTASYGQTLSEIVAFARSARVEPIVLTVPRAFSGMPRDQQEGLAATALYFFSCLDIEGLLMAGEMFNAEIRELHDRTDVSLVDLGAIMPGGKQYFVDAGHFTREGEEFAAKVLFDTLFKDAAAVARMAESGVR